MITLLSVLLLAAETPATIQEQPAPAASQIPVKEQKQEAEKKICRTKLIDTGSRMRKTDCRTQADWDRRDRGQNIDDMKRVGGR